MFRKPWLLTVVFIYALVIWLLWQTAGCSSATPC